jgi:type IV fimbrial biogenesis protein FimT
MRRQDHIPHRETGISLVETLICVAITSLVLGAGLPSFEAATERRHLEGGSAQLETDIQLARSEAVLRNRTVRLSVAATASGSCYLVHTGKAGDCRCSPDASAICIPGAVALRSVGFRAGGTLQLRSNVSAIVFDPVKGTSTPTGTLRFTGRQGREIRLVVNLMGRVRSCSPTDDLAGYVRC